MSWTDNFDDASLDSSKFGTSVAGDGAVAEASGTVNITMGAATANGALVYLKDAIVSNADYVYTVRHKVDGSILGGLNLFSIQDGIPAVGTAAANHAKKKIRVWIDTASDKLLVGYKNTAGTWYYWTGTAWSTSYGGIVVISSAYWFDVSFIVRNAKWRISISAFGDTKSLVETPWIAFSALEAYTTLYAFWGDNFSDFWYVTSMKTEYCIFSNETKVYAYYNGGNAPTSTVYKIGKSVSYDGGTKYFRDSEAAIISALAGESYVKDPWVILVGGTYYLFYSALITATSKWRIRYATSTDQETWTDQGYITAPGGGGAYDEKGHLFPVVTYESGTWRMYVGGQNVSNLITVGYFYGASLGSLTNYASNPVITVGVGGTWDDSNLLPVGITASGTTISLHILGLKASTSKWQGGLWTSTDWIAWTPDGGNPIIVMDASKRTTASNALINATSLTVGDSTIFANDDPIIIGDGSNVHTNRVISKADSTHITLYYPSPTAYTAPTVWGYNAGSVGIEGLDLVNFPNDALGVTFQASAVLCETTAWWHYSAGWAYDPSKTPPLSLGVGWDEASSENLKWIHNGITLVLDVTVDAGLQSGSKSLFSVSENTDQVLGQGLIAKAGSLLSPSFVLDHILIQNLQSGNKTIFSASNITDQILSQNLLASITSVLSVLVSLDQDVSVNVIPVAGSLYEVTVDTGAIVNVGLLLAVGSALETLLQTDQILSQGIIEKLGSVFASSQNTDQILQQNMIAALGAILSSSQSVDQTVQLNALSALASIYQILVQILAAPEKFGYLNLKLELPPALPEGSFAYEHSSLKVIDEGLEGSFNYEHQKSTVEENLLGWFVMPWFSDWFGEEAGFQFEHQRLMESAPVEGANFEFENLKPVIPPVISNDDFKYKRF